MRPRFSLLSSALLALALCTGCIPGEDPIAPYDRGPVKIQTVGMEADYRNRVFVDLGTGEVVATHPVTGWDLGFSTGDAAPVVILNTAKIMAAADAGAVAFDAVRSTGGLRWNYDQPSGHPDSTAIGMWWSDGGGHALSLGHVYVIDRGVDAAGKHLGYRKCMLEGYAAGVYTVRYARLDGAGDTTVHVATDTRYAHIGLSFDDGATLPTAPPSDTWDIVFTRYTHIFYEPELMPYSVTGVHINTPAVEVAVDSLKPFAGITTADLASYTFSPARDGVGYAWKTFHLDRGEFEVHPQIVFILRDRAGFYYKLHFTDFYNEQGQKGFPTFEYQKL